MERKLIRATLVIVWQCRPIQSRDLNPEHFFGPGGTMGIGEQAFIFKSAIDPESGMADEITYGPGTLSIACVDPASIPILFSKAWAIFATEEAAVQLGPAGYNAEYEWIGLGGVAEEWILRGYLKESRLKNGVAACLSLCLGIYHQVDGVNQPHFLTLEPRRGDDNALFGLVVRHFEKIPNDLDAFVKGIIPFAASAAAEIAEPNFPQP